MNKGIVFSLLLLFSIGTLIADEIINFKEEDILPSNFKKLLKKSELKKTTDLNIIRLYERLKKKAWNISVKAGYRRFRIIPSNELFFNIPKFLYPVKSYSWLALKKHLFVSNRIEYSDRAYQFMVQEDERKYDDPTIKKGGKIKKGGWKWDISKDIRLVLRGTQDIDVSYGDDIIPPNLREGTHVRRVGVKRGFRLAQSLNLNLVGRIGPKVAVSIDHNSKRKENIYDISYKGRGDEFVKEIKAGNIDMTIPGSKYVVYSGGSKSAFGIKATLANKRLKIQAILSLTKGVSETKSFKGAKKETAILIKDVSYIKHRYYQLPVKDIIENSLLIYLSTTQTNQGTLIGGGYYILLNQGKDYSYNRATGQVNMSKPVTKDQNLLAYYQGGTQISFVPVPLLEETISESGKTYLYLKQIGTYSRFERKGVYSLGYRDIDITRGFEFYIKKTSDGVRSTDAQFQSSEYIFNSETGVIEFNALEPFQDKAGITELLYHSVNDPQFSDSVYSLYFAFLYKVNIFQLRFNVVAGSERVLINNTPVTRNVDYRIDYLTGTLRFLRIINENDDIQVSYEYKPYSTSLQRVLTGLRVDYKITEGATLGATMLYSVGQKPTGAPTLANTPDSKLLFDFDGKFDLLKILGLKTKKWVVKFEAEVAYSVHDKNTVDKAIVADMEADSIGYAITRSEDQWKIGSPSPNIPGITQSGRGKLHYRDYRDYGANNHFTLESYYWGIPADQILSYARKPGPYIVKGGRNESTAEISENSIVFEYDFSGGKTWVSAVSSIAGAGGIDLSKINELLLSVKHQMITGTDGNGNAVYGDSAGNDVYIYFELGSINEDADGDLVFDSEVSISSGGYEFNPLLADSTFVGSGRKDLGNGIKDSEDLNRDNVFQTNEMSILFPSTNTTDLTNINVASGSDWQEVTMKIQNLTIEQVGILERVSAIRITVVKGVSGDRGRLMIDRAYFKGSRWDFIKIDDQTIKTAPEFSASIISTRENDDYKDNRIYKEYPDDFEDLHGRLSAVEEERLHERALQIKYNLSNQTRSSNQFGTFGTVTKTYNSNLDFTIYKKLKLYLFIKEKAGHTNEYFIYRLGNSTDRYYEWRIPLVNLHRAIEAGTQKKWHLVEIFLNPDDVSKRLHVYANGIDYGKAVLSAKTPNLRQVNRVTVGIDVTGTTDAENKGEIWVNEVHLTDDRKRTGRAWSLRGEIQNKNKLRLFGIPIIGPFSFNYSMDRVGIGFRSIGQAGSDSALNSVNTSGKLNFLEYFDLSMSYSDKTENSDTDINYLPVYLQYISTNKTYTHSIVYKDPRGYFPTIVHSYNRSITKKIQHRIDSTNALNTNETIIDTDKFQYSESASIKSTMKLPYGFTYDYSISDSVYLTDTSDKTNGIEGSWFTNSTTKGYATYAKKESHSLKFSQRDLFGLRSSSFAITGTVFKEKENFNTTFSADGFRTEIAMFEKQRGWYNYVDRVEALLSGIGNLEQSISGTNQNSIANGYSLSSSLRNIGFFSIDYSFTSSTKDSSFTRMTNGFIVNNNSSSAKNSLSLPLKIKGFFLHSLQTRWNRNYSFTMNQGTELMENIWSKFKGDFFKPPFYYLGFFGSGGRKNNLDFVKKFSGNIENTQVTLHNDFSITGKFDYGKTIFQELLPEYITLSVNQNTTRNMSSYIQNGSWTLTAGKRFKIKKLGFWIFDEKSRKGKSVQDLDVRFSLGKKFDYNSKVITSDIKSSMSFAVRWNRYTSISIAYQLEWNYSYQSLFESDKDYVYMGIGEDTGDGTGDSFGDIEETTGGAAPGITEYPELEKYIHTVKISHSFPSRHSGVWNLFGWKIKIDGNWKHKNELTLQFINSSYARNRGDLYKFNELFYKPFFMSLKHSIDYDFSKSWNGIFYVLFMFEKWTLVQPSTDAKSLNEDFFDLSFGFEIGLKMQIRL